MEKSDELPKERRKRAEIDEKQQTNVDRTSPTAVKHIKLEDKSEKNNEVVKSQVTIFQLPSDVWRSICPYISDSDVVSLSAVSEHFQQIVQEIKSSFNLSKNYRLDVDYFSNYALSETCTSIDISYCKWLTPNTIIEMISKTNLRHLHVIQCQMNEDCVRSICNLPLQSLSFTYTNQWRSYFIENIHKSLPCFQTLTKLIIEVNKDKRSIIFDIYMNVLQYCNELQRLKLFGDCKISGYSHTWNMYCAPPEPSKFPSAQSTSLLKLTSLEVTTNLMNCEADVCALLKAILKDKVIPLNDIDFGRFTCYLLKDGILNHPLILKNKSRFILRGDSACGLDIKNYKHYEDKICNWMGQTTFETVLVQNFKFYDFEPFAEKMVIPSGKAIKQLYILDCLIKFDFDVGIEGIGFHCPQITVLHLLIQQVDHNESYFDMLENETVLDAIKLFKNLKELVLSPCFLHCNYNNEDGSQCFKIMPLWKVTQSCQQLTEIRLKSAAYDSYIPTIHVDTLNDIAHCKTLRVLELSHFEIGGSKKHPLSKIAKNCCKLEHLSIQQINVGKRRSNYILGNILNCTKDLKILSIYMDQRFLTEAFLKNLSTCEKLESITFGLYFPCSVTCESDVGNLVQVLPKLKNLFVFGVRLTSRSEKQPKPVIEQIKSLFKKIKKQKPSFSGFFF